VAQLSLPIALDALGEKGKRNVVGTAAGAAQLADHAHGAVGVAGVDEYRGGALQVGIRAEPRSDRVAGSLVVCRIRIVVLWMQVVIEKDRVVRTGTQQLLSFDDVVGDVDHVAFEARREPAMASFIIVQEKHTNGMTFSSDAR
jgi:hypothetical protein